MPYRILGYSLDTSKIKMIIKFCLWIQRGSYNTSHVVMVEFKLSWDAGLSPETRSLCNVRHLYIYWIIDVFMYLITSETLPINFVNLVSLRTCICILVSISVLLMYLLILSIWQVINVESGCRMQNNNIRPFM